MSLLYEIKRDNIKYKKETAPLQYPAHFHSHIELVKMISGKVNCYTDANKYSVEAGDIFIAFPNQIHYYESLGPEEYVIFYINPEIVPQFLSLFESNVPKSSHITAKKISGKLDALFNSIIESCEEVKMGKKYSEEIRGGYVQAFFGELLRHMELYGPDSGELSALKNIVDFCSKNYTKEISLDLLSKELHMSKYYISHIFGSRLNMRFNDYVNSLRVSKACLLLADNDASITAVSDSVGFSTIRTFNRAFLRQTGKSPREYRRTIAQVKKLSATGSPVVNFKLPSKEKKADKDAKKADNVKTENVKTENVKKTDADGSVKKERSEK